jgi:HSP20 family protein
MRAFTLPKGLDIDATSANLANGVLEVRIPRQPDAQPRKIPVAQK